MNVNIDSPEAERDGEADVYLDDVYYINCK